MENLLKTVLIKKTKKKQIEHVRTLKKEIKQLLVISSCLLVILDAKKNTREIEKTNERYTHTVNAEFYIHSNISKRILNNHTRKKTKTKKKRNHCIGRQKTKEKTTTTPRKMRIQYVRTNEKKTMC